MKNSDLMMKKFLSNNETNLYEYMTFECNWRLNSIKRNQVFNQNKFIFVSAISFSTNGLLKTILLICSWAFVSVQKEVICAEKEPI